MSITVRELVAESHLGLTVLAGSVGMDTAITWAHTSDLPRLWEWVTGGELLMTNGLSIPEDEAAQVDLAERLVAAGASALAVGERMHAPTLQPGFLAACDALPLALLSIPYPLPFIAIARSVADAMLVEESRRLRQTTRIYDLLRLDPGAGWRPVLDGLGRELDADLHVAHADCLHAWHPEDPAAPDEVTRVAVTGEPSREQGHRAFRWHRLDDGTHVFAVGVPAHQDAVLLALPHAGDRPDAVVLLHAATVLGLQMSRVVLDLEYRRRTGADVLARGLDGRQRHTETEAELAEAGVPVADGWLIASVTSPAGEHGRLDAAQVSLWRHGIPAACLVRDGRLHVAVARTVDLDVVRHALGDRVRIGVSEPAGALGLQRALEESVWSLGLATEDRPVVRYGDGTSWLGVTGVEEGRALVRRYLGPILDHDRTRQGDLLLTLSTFLDHQRSWQKTADALFTHRQTVIHRVRRIGELIGLDMTQTSTLAQLWIALQLHRALGPETTTAGDGPPARRTSPAGSPVE